MKFITEWLISYHRKRIVRKQILSILDNINQFPEKWMLIAEESQDANLRYKTIPETFTIQRVRSTDIEQDKEKDDQPRNVLSASNGYHRLSIHVYIPSRGWYNTSINTRISGIKDVGGLYYHEAFMFKNVIKKHINFWMNESNKYPLKAEGQDVRSDLKDIKSDLFGKKFNKTVLDD